MDRRVVDSGLHRWIVHGVIDIGVKAGPISNEFKELIEHCRSSECWKWNYTPLARALFLRRRTYSETEIRSARLDGSGITVVDDAWLESSFP